jgi:hypothetical protein
VRVRGKPTLATLVRRALRDHGTCEVRTTGASMLPAVAPGQVVTLEQAESIQVGDVVAFERNGQLCCHRVAATSPILLLTVGDNNPLYDYPVARGDVIGKCSSLSAPPLMAAAGERVDFHLWVTGRVKEDRLTALRRRYQARENISIDRLPVEGAVQAVAALTAKGPIIGVSPLARRSIDEIAPLLAGASRLDFILGGDFGLPGTGLLPYQDLTALVRIAPPVPTREHYNLEAAAGYVIGFVDGCRRREGEGIGGDAT